MSVLCAELGESSEAAVGMVQAEAVPSWSHSGMAQPWGSPVGQ